MPTTFQSKAFLVAASLLVAMPARQSLSAAPVSAAPKSAPVGASVTVIVSGVANASGHILVALCPQKQFLSVRCSYHGEAPARPGTVAIRIDGIPPGRYAAQAFHDDTNTRVLERSFIGLPRKGLGFSRDAAMRFGPPRFDEASFEVGNAPIGTSITLRYP